MYIYIYIYTHMYNVDVDMAITIYIYIHVYVCVYIYIYTHTYIHTCFPARLVLSEHVACAKSNKLTLFIVFHVCYHCAACVAVSTRLVARGAAVGFLNFRRLRGYLWLQCSCSRRTGLHQVHLRCSDRSLARWKMCKPTARRTLLTSSHGRVTNWRRGQIIS